MKKGLMIFGVLAIGLATLLKKVLGSKKDEVKPSLHPNKVPIGVMPYYIWIDKYPDPGLEDLLQRYNDVNGAIDRYRKAGLPVNRNWLREVLLGVGEERVEELSQNAA